MLHALSGLAPENYLCKIIFVGTVRCAPQRRSDTVSRLVHSLSLKSFSRARLHGLESQAKAVQTTALNVCSMTYTTCLPLTSGNPTIIMHGLTGGRPTKTASRTVLFNAVHLKQPCYHHRLLLFCTFPPLYAGALWQMPAWVWRDVRSLFLFYCIVHCLDISALEQCSIPTDTTSGGHPCQHGPTLQLSYAEGHEFAAMHEMEDWCRCGGCHWPTVLGKHWST